ncbi:MAG: 16S rRNA (cytidine(1402)-2'-O)-methyltransferase [Thermodesulfobacteriota bacterium]
MDDVADSRFQETLTGVLYVVGTPIGNLEDITLRALRTLGEVDLIAAEDTRNTRRLLTRHGINRPLISLHEHNEDRRTAELISKLGNGTAIALVSDAGTPTVSDPGYRLVKDAVAAGIRVVPIPGPSAAVAALSVSGLPTDAFLFLGFPPRKRTKRLKFLGQVAEETKTLIFYESPRRMADLLADLQDVMGERRAVLSREMTKTYEEFMRGTLNKIAAEVEKRKELKGECTLLVEGVNRHEEVSPEKLHEIVVRELAREDMGASALSRRLAGQYNISKNKVYAEILRLNRSKGKAE